MNAQFPIQVKLGFDQIQAVIDQMPEDDKERLAVYLDRQMVAGRIERLRKGASNFPLSDEEIQAQVKIVRQERHAAGRR
jgi:hypothetical protein